MQWNFNNDMPIYIQLVEQLKIFIITGVYQAGQKIPSVRELAMETKVNPNTMQKALVELENLGLIITQRTSGKFVTEDKQLVENLKNEIAKTKSKEFLLLMKKLNYSINEIVDCLKNIEGEET